MDCTLVVVLTWLVIVIYALCAALGGWALFFVIRDRAVILRQLWAAAIIEFALLIQLVLGGVLLAGSTHDVDPVTFWGYLIVILLILPFQAVWAFAERSRWSSVVLLVATLTVVFLEFRLVQIWGM